jgi:hypothetical protein
MTPHTHPDRIIEQFDDYGSFDQAMERTPARADALIARYRSGAQLSESERTELPRLLRTLRRLLNIHLNENSQFVQEDLADGSRDELEAAERLRRQIADVRSMHFTLNSWWWTRAVRRIGGFFEDVGSWLGVKWDKLKDNMSQLFKGAGYLGVAATPVVALAAGPAAGLITGAGTGLALYLSRLFSGVRPVQDSGQRAPEPRPQAA